MNTSFVAQANKQKGVSVGWAKYGGVVKAFEAQYLKWTLQANSYKNKWIQCQSLFFNSQFVPAAKMGIREAHCGVAAPVWCHKLSTMI